MCGVMGYIGGKPCSEIIYKGLKRLEYRGYDSAGIAVIHSEHLHVIKSEGKLSGLETKLSSLPPKASVGMGHTRWATHGAPTELNAHPHANERIAIIHNGIFENYYEFKQDFLDQGMKFRSETDSEVFLPLLEKEIKKNSNKKAALTNVFNAIKGTYGVAILFADEPGSIYLAKQGSPLALGIGEGEMFFASDGFAFNDHTKKVVFLEDGEIARLSADGYEIWNLEGKPVERAFLTLQWASGDTEKDGFRHYMLKEIHEQAKVLGEFISRTFDANAKFSSLELEKLRTVESIHIIGCGTAYLAGMVGKYFLESRLRLPVQVELASEFRYRQPCLPKNTLVIAMTQSGETADTLASVKLAKQLGCQILSICNVAHSSIPRESHLTLYMQAGAEMGVASTKAFTAMVANLYALSIAYAVKHDLINKDDLNASLASLRRLPSAIDEIISQKHKIEGIAKHYAQTNNALFIGRGLSYPIALEAALKLKEISYIHAEGYAGGELKHGPIALVDSSMPIIAIVPSDRHHDKMLSNIEEVCARSGRVLAVADEKDEKNDKLKKLSEHMIHCPQLKDEALQSILSIIPLQLFAYYIAVFRGTDVDQPRNLAKSVTVE